MTGWWLVIGGAVLGVVLVSVMVIRDARRRERAVRDAMGTRGRSVDLIVTKLSADGKADHVITLHDELHFSSDVRVSPVLYSAWFQAKRRAEEIARSGVWLSDRELIPPSRILALTLREHPEPSSPDHAPRP